MFSRLSPVLGDFDGCLGLLSKNVLWNNLLGGSLMLLKILIVSIVCGLMFVLVDDYLFAKPIKTRGSKIGKAKKKINKKLPIESDDSEEDNKSQTSNAEGVGRKGRQIENIFHRLNTQKTFEKVKKLDAFVFLIGNNDYKRRSGFAPLNQCANDVLLLSRIFEHCSKVDKRNIYENYDLTYDEFIVRFKKFIEIVKKKKNYSVIITYSGHGDVGGSLVFVDGKQLKADVLKKLVNSFDNDTILILDACYSGANEGPKEMFLGEKQGIKFKDNSIRIYASLAHLTAKEILYNNSFFKHMRSFFKGVLGIDRLTGNGFFTGLVGMFFAEYKFKKNENISFNDLVNYVTNRGKQYVEYLAFLAELYPNQKKHAHERLNQQPKILPVQERVGFNDRNNNFILIQKYIRANNIELSAFGGIMMPIGAFSGVIKNINAGAELGLAYQFQFFPKNLFVKLNVQYYNMSSIHDDTRRDISLNIVIPSLGFKYNLFKMKFFSMSVGADVGYAFTFKKAGSFGPLKETTNTLYNFYYGGHLNFNFELFDQFYIVVPVRFLSILYADEKFYGLTFYLGIQYYF